MSLINDLTEAIRLQQAHQDRDYQEMMSKSLQERVAKGHTLANVDISIDFYEGAPNDFCPYLRGSNKFINLVTINCGDNVSRFRAGTPVVLSHRDGYRFKMTIEEDKIDKMVLVSGDFEVKNNYIDCISYPKHGWEINEENLGINSRLLGSARDRLSSNSVFCSTMSLMLGGNLDNNYRNVYVSPSNNSSQDCAIRKALGCSHFHLIQGPPGTGKTYTIARIVKELIRNNQKVFVTGPTHTAINNCLNAISKQIPDKSKIVKIGEKNQAEEILANTYITRKTRLSIYAYEESNLSQGGIVIGATPYALCYPAAKKLQGWDFDYVIIDEAAQMSIPLALAALTYGKKMIFVGDHKQLDPIIPTGTNNWLFDKSVFKHMVDKYPNDITLLDQSYRLSDSLVNIPARMFYGGRLKSARTSDNKEFVDFYCDFEYGRIIKDSNNEILYLHHEFDSLGRSPYEANLSADIVATLKDNGVALKDIAVITPYRAQVREVKKALKNKHIISEENLEEIFVDTIERMQGQEKDYVIFSLANSNPSEVEDRLEFFYSPNRLNVAITRARTKCIVIANEKVFKLCENASPYSREGDGMRTFWEYYSLAHKIYAPEIIDEEW